MSTFVNLLLKIRLKGQFFFRKVFNKRVNISLGVTFGLLVFVFWWNGNTFNFKLESFFIKWASLIKYSTYYSKKNNNYEKDVLFVNAWSKKMLIPNADDSGDRVLVDRNSLAIFFSQLGKYELGETIIICDLIFEEESEFDEDLTKQLSNINASIFFPEPTSDTYLNKTISSKFVRGYVDYSTTNSWWHLTDEFLKYPLFNKTGQKSLVIRVFESLEGNEVKLNKNLIWIDGKPHFRNITVDESVRSYNYKDSIYNNILNIEDVNFLLSLENEISEKLLSKKFIIIGNFETDIHKTAFGLTPGPIILYNLLLSLQKRNNRITFLWCVFVFTSMFWIIYFTLHQDKNNWITRKNILINIWFGKLFGSFVSNAIWIWLISIISYFFFGLTLDVVAIILMIGLISFINKLLNFRKHGFLDKSNFSPFNLEKYLKKYSGLIKNKIKEDE